MRFSESGPDFPIDLIQASLSGDVVFLCGAGISQTAGLPSFEGLVTDVYAALAMEPTVSERIAWDTRKYEEALGALSRRLADRRRLLEAVSERLAPNENMNLAAHRAVLRISRDVEGRPAVVTTNFDTLFERALVSTFDADAAVDMSTAGAELPSPGGTRFLGVMHLHGRLADSGVGRGLPETDLVLTSAQYGDAYLRSGWASRFLFDVARCKRIVMVGYSADDPPVRYILNILEADRERFPDLNAVYALAGRRREDDETAAARWQTVAVEPLLYDSNSDHAVLWSDLEEWASLTDAPRVWRKSRLEAFLARPADDLANWERDQAKWILGHEDAVSVFLDADPGQDWIAFLESERLIAPEGAYDWAVGKWASTRLSEPSAFKALVAVAPRLGSRAADLIDIQLSQKEAPAELPALLRTGWTLFIHGLRDRQPGNAWRWHTSKAIRRIRSGEWVSRDLDLVAKQITPSLQLAPLSALSRHAGVADPPKVLSDLCSLEMEAGDHLDVEKIGTDEAMDVGTTVRLLDRVVSQLVGALEVAKDAGLAGDRLDRPSMDVPSISSHAQNTYRHGFMDIVRLVDDLWQRVANRDASAALLLAERLRRAGFALTDRIALHFLQRDIFSADDAVRALLDLDDDGFWLLRREVALLMRARAGDASSDLQGSLLKRVVSGPPRSDHDDDEDHREAHRRYRIRMYLRFLVEAGRDIGGQARREVDKLVAEDPALADPPDEDALFLVRFYSRSGRRGDPAPLKHLAPTERLEELDRLELEDGWEHTDTWRMYCVDDPEGSLDTLLATSPSDEAWSKRWGDLLFAVAERVRRADEAQRADAIALVQRTLSELDDAPDGRLVQVLWSLVDLWLVADELKVRGTSRWWERLWSLAELEASTSSTAGLDEPEPLDTLDTAVSTEEIGYRSINEALNRAGGRLAFAMIQRLDRRWDDLNENGQRVTRQRLKVALSSASLAGFHARTMAIEHVHFVYWRLPALVKDVLAPALKGDAPSARALREILVAYAKMPKRDLRRELRQAILQGVREHRGGGVSSYNAAFRIVSEIVAMHEGSGDDSIFVTPLEARTLLREARPSVRAGAAEVLANLLAGEKAEDRGAAWTSRYWPAFKDLWPYDAALQTEATSRHLAEFACAAGDQFPDALDKLQHYIRPLATDEWPHLHFLSPKTASALLEKFPRDVVALLWCLLRPPARGSSVDLPKILDALVAADPSLHLDRRFQGLQERELRH